MFLKIKHPSYSLFYLLFRKIAYGTVNNSNLFENYPSVKDEMKFVK